MYPERCGNGEEDLRLEKGEVSENEKDLPPEYHHYRDEGCEFAVSCLSCPFPQCFDGEPRGKQHWVKNLRNKEIARLYGSGEWGERDLARLYGLSQRTIQRVLKSTISISSVREGNKQRRYEGR